MKDEKKLIPFDRVEVRKLALAKDWEALRNYDLKGADLSNFYLAGADLSGMDISGAVLSSANLTRADLSGTNLSGICLIYAKLIGANLTGADLRGADLFHARLRGADLTGVFVDDSTKWYYLHCPEEGEFIGYKKAYDSLDFPYIVKLRIPAHALRSSATSEKCRCSEAEVVSITDLYGEETDTTIVYSAYDQFFAYRTGEIVKVNNFCEDRWQECAPGIHFFMEREKAVDYDF